MARPRVSRRGGGRDQSTERRTVVPSRTADASVSVAGATGVRSSLGSREREHPYLVKSVSRLNVLSETSDTTRGAEAHAEPSASAPNALNTS